MTTALIEFSSSPAPYQRPKNHNEEPIMTDLPDTGCQFSPACLSCHLPACVYDEPNIIPALKREARYSIIRDALQTQTPSQAADSLGVSLRTIYRAVSNTSRKKVRQ